MNLDADKLREENEKLKKQLASQSIELDHKKRELEIEAALEKVRVKVAGMQSSAGLDETSAVLFKQISELGIEVLRSSVGILDDANDAMELWVTSIGDDGSLVRVLDYVNLHVHPVFENIIPARKEKKPFAVTILEGPQVKAYYEDVGNYLHITRPKKIRTKEYYYAFFFREGSINVVTDHALSDNECHIMVRFAFAFGLVYTRFLELQKAEANLAALKATQSHLIQTEKMASLGELTAGIAHEIQNPLNFVRNFSEVNNELLEELVTALKAGNQEEALSLAEDILVNEKKLVHHGKRADNIVKSMLLHSRPSSATREPTNINALAEEYLQLSFQALRNKNKSFSVTYQTDYDPAMGKVIVNGQDMGRVILNLLTNAFHALTERGKKEEKGYTPVVQISTRRMDETVMISVKDNGTGIPEHIVSKIFQPFFTTKEAGEGTGLGLSLAYDIITKGHGGDLQVNTKEGEGTEFIITLPAGLFQS